MSHTPTGRRLACALLIAGTLGGATTASAATEIVSRTGNEASLPFPAQLVSASPDGRFVVLKLGLVGRPPAATGPEAEVTSPSGYVIRDRTAQTVTPVDVEAADGSQITSVGQIAGDGKRLLVVAGGSPAAYDLASGKLLALPAAPGPAKWAKLSEDGASAAVVIDGPSGEEIYRGPIGGTGTKVAIDLPKVRVASISDDLQTILYDRETQVTWTGATLPSTVRVVGVKQGAGAPHVIASANQVREPYGVCSEPPTGYRVRTTNVGATALSGDGGRAVSGYSTVDSASSGLQIGGFRLRQASGETREYARIGSSYIPRLQALGRTHDLAIIPLTGRESTPSWTRVFVDGDRTVISSGLGGYGPGEQPGRYTTADPSTLADEPIAPATISFGASEPVDTAAFTPPSTDKPCETPPAAEILPVGEYQSFLRATPLRSAAPMGSIVFQPFPGGARKATAMTIEIKAFGLFTLWRKTVSATTEREEVRLPRPLAFVPETVRVTIQLEPGDGGAPATPLVQQYSVYATR